MRRRHRTSRAASPRELAAVLLTVCGLLGCETAPACPLEASSCSGDCAPIEGARIVVAVDGGNPCRSEFQTVGCRDKDSENAGNLGCFVRVSDGAIFDVLSSTKVDPPNWRPCDRSEGHLGNIAKECSSVR